MNEELLPQPHTVPPGEGNPPDQMTGVPMPVSQRVFVRALKWSVVATLVLAVLFAIIGWLVSEQRGLYGGLIGAVGAGIFMGLTLGSMAFANRLHKNPLYLQLFFAIVLGAWVLKLILFVVAALLLRSQLWLDPQILFISVICGALVSLVIDVIVVTRTRIPLIDGTD